jgi:hypothetical protein
MMDRTSFVASAICFTSLFAACGSYSDEPTGKGGTGGSTGGTTATTGGTTATAGSGGTGGSSGAATGGSGPGTGGASGAGGGTSGAAGAAGTGGASGSSGAGGAPMGGASGAGGSAGGGPVSCADVPACGGDVTGAWTAASCEMTVGSPLNLTAAGIGCTSAVVTAGKLKVSGTWTGMAGGMYTDATTTTGTLNFELEEVCLDVSGFKAACDRLSFQTVGLSNVVCVKNEATMGCTCEATIEQYAGMGHIAQISVFNEPTGTTGTYTVADNKLTTLIEDEDEPSGEYSYCVAGNTMTMKVTSIGALALTGNIVLQKP